MKVVKVVESEDVPQLNITKQKRSAVQHHLQIFATLVDARCSACRRKFEKKDFYYIAAYAKFSQASFQIRKCTLLQWKPWWLEQESSVDKYYSS